MASVFFGERLSEVKSSNINSKRLKQIPWNKLLKNMRSKIEDSERKIDTRRKIDDISTEKKLGMMRLALTHKLQKKMKQEVDTSFFLDIIDLLARATELTELYEEDLEEWIEFLDMIERKLESEGLVVENEEMLEQSRRMKVAIDKLRRKLHGTGGL